MTGIVFLIEQTALGLYILLGVGIFWYFRKWLLARFDYRASPFELERDLSRRRQGSAFTAMTLLAELFLVVIGVQQVVAPTVRQDMEAQVGEVQEQVEDDGIFVTPTRPAPSGELPPVVDASGVDLGGQDAVSIFATPTMTPTPVGTILPNAPPVIGCQDDHASLQIPANGMRVFQPIRVAGTAYVDNFAQYTIEIAREGGQFARAHTEVVPLNELGTLAQFNPGPYDPGTYQFRLMVFDTTDTLRAHCQVTIYISEPIPTATPLGSS